MTNSIARWRHLSLLPLAVAVWLHAVGGEVVAQKEAIPNYREGVAKRLSQPIDPKRSINALADDCLLYIALIPDFGDAARQRLKDAATLIMDRRDENGDGKVGWGLAMEDERKTCAGPGTRAGLTLDRKTCNAAGNEYTYQTGLAMTCLARGYAAIRDQRMLETAVSAARDSWNMGDADRPCPDCFTYWPSYSENDRGRYIRNMNVAMGMGLAALFKATSNREFADRARAVARAESWEIAQRNRGYLGASDPGFLRRPAWESARTENHAILVALGLRDIGRDLGDTGAQRDAVRVIEQWIGCTDGRCQRGECTYWAAAPKCALPQSLASCVFRASSDTAAAHCDSVRSRVRSWSNLALLLMLDR